ncbi:MAG: PhnA protein, partial [Paracoccaceae bacterium]|nr:PhnA protein [Paracoccaceae bacterium]
MDDLKKRAGDVCEFCGANDGLSAVDVPPAGPVLLCATCQGDAPAAHWRCLEGAAWSDVPAVQVAVWRKLGTLGDAWAAEARAGMSLPPEVEAMLEVAGTLTHRDANGAVLAQGDTVVLI